MGQIRWFNWPPPANQPPRPRQDLIQIVFLHSRLQSLLYEAVFCMAVEFQRGLIQLYLGGGNSNIFYFHPYLKLLFQNRLCGWWQLKYLLFWPFWRACFSNGLKPPTSHAMCFRSFFSQILHPLSKKRCKRISILIGRVTFFFFFKNLVLNPHHPKQEKRNHSQWNQPFQPILGCDFISTDIEKRKHDKYWQAKKPGPKQVLHVLGVGKFQDATASSPVKLGRIEIHPKAWWFQVSLGLISVDGSELRLTTYYTLKNPWCKNWEILYIYIYQLFFFSGFLKKTVCLDHPTETNAEAP